MDSFSNEHPHTCFSVSTQMIVRVVTLLQRASNICTSLTGSLMPQLVNLRLGTLKIKAYQVVSLTNMIISRSQSIALIYGLYHDEIT